MQDAHPHYASTSASAPEALEDTSVVGAAHTAAEDCSTADGAAIVPGKAPGLSPAADDPQVGGNEPHPAVEDEAGGTSAQPDGMPMGQQGDPSQPWVLRLGNYLLRGKDEAAATAVPREPWALRLGKYLDEKRPGPWSILANEKPHDPMALRLGTFLNETKPLKLLHPASETESDPAEPVVLRLGNYLLGSKEESPAPGERSSEPAAPPTSAAETASFSHKVDESTACDTSHQAVLQASSPAKEIVS
ncbi:hypothetical protein AB1Y20_012226 [Prymnesium parvum]|uniref:Uncharacterized protein n=1 Tax=Prymnesium parvum TaxID=97485 RepID=A0AB34INH2_PRYPA